MITEIISGLWIGNIDDSYDMEFYKDNKITIMINCTNDIPCLDIPETKKIKIPLSVYLDPSKDIPLLKNNMKRIIEYIHQHKETDNIFIYGHTNYSIPSLIIGAYMITYGKISIHLIMDILHSKNKDIVLDMNFKDYL
jgi:hypothetical protein